MEEQDQYGRKMAASTNSQIFISVVVFISPLDSPDPSVHHQTPSLTSLGSPKHPPGRSDR